MRYAWIMLLLGSVVAQNQKATVETMTMEQIEARTSLVVIYSEHEAQHPVKVSVPKDVIVRGVRIPIAHDDETRVGHCGPDGIHISRYLGESSSRRVLWHEIKHYCLNSCTHSHDLNTGWDSDIEQADSIIESTAACELSVLRTNPKMLRWLAKKEK